MTAALEARGLARDYAVPRGAFRAPATVKALAGVSFALKPGGHWRSSASPARASRRSPDS